MKKGSFDIAFGFMYIYIIYQLLLSFFFFFSYHIIVGERRKQSSVCFVKSNFAKKKKKKSIYYITSVSLGSTSNRLDLNVQISNPSTLQIPKTVSSHSGSFTSNHPKLNSSPPSFSTSLVTGMV